MSGRYVDGSRVVYWDDTNGNLTVPATLTANSIVGASFTLGPNVTFSSVTASTITVGTTTVRTITSASDIQVRTSTFVISQDATIVGDVFSYDNYVANTIDYSGIVSSFTTFSNPSGIPFAANNNYASHPAISANGQTQVITGLSTVWRSLDYGSSWVSTTTLNNLAYFPPSVSATGKLITVPTRVVLTGAANYLYMSYDYGSNWTQGSIEKLWCCVAMSASGQYQIAGTYGDFIYITSNYGTTWTAVTTLGTTEAWQSVAISASGQYMTVAPYNNRINTSSDYGVTWTVRTSGGTGQPWGRISMSASGKYQIAPAVTIGNPTYISSDYGVTWAGSSVLRAGSAIMSYSGQYVLGADQGYSYSVFSSDYGSNFVRTNMISGPNFSAGYSISMSASVQYMIAIGSFASNNYTYRTIRPILFRAGLSTTQITTGSLVAENLSSLSAQVGRMIISSLVGNNMSSLSEQTGIFTANRTTVSSLVGNNVSSLSEQTGVFTGTQTTVSSLVGNNLSSLSAQVGIFTANRTTVSSLVGNTLITSTLQAINDVTSHITATSSLVAPVQFYAQELYTKDVYDYSTLGTSFSQTAASRVWNGIAVSANGQYQTATVNGGFLYSSSNFGASWTQVGTSQGWARVAMNATGEIQLACVGYGSVGSTGKLWRSTNYGATWTELTATQPSFWYAVAVSASGQYMTATEIGGGSVPSTGYIWTSSNYGVTWTRASVSLAVWAGVSISASGQFQTAVVNAGTIYRSSDYGQTWVSTGVTNDSFVPVAISASGQYQTCASQTSSGGQGRLYVSSDYGTTWTNTYGPSSINFISVAMSASGRYQMAVTATTVYVSSTFGTSWTLSSTVGTFLYSVALSASGNYGVLVDSNPGFIYRSTVPLLLPTTSSLTTQTGILATNQVTTSSILSLTMSTGSAIAKTLTVSSILGFSPVSFVNDVIFTSTVNMIAPLSTASIQTSSITTNTFIGGSISSLSLNVGTLTATTFTPPPATSVSTFTVQTSSFTGNNVSSLSAQVGGMTVSSLLANNISSLASQTGVWTGTQATVSSLVGNNISSLSLQAGGASVSSLVGNNVSSLSAQAGGMTVSSLVGNNLSSLLLQAGLFTGVQATVSSLVGNNISSLSAQTGVFTGTRTTVSSLVGNNVSTIVLQTSSILTNGIVATTINATTFTVTAFISSIVSSVFTYLSSSTVQTSSLTSINISSLFGQIGVLAASHTSVSSISASTITTNTITSINPLKLNVSTVIATQDSLVVEDFLNYNTFTTNPIDYTNIASSFTSFNPGFFCQNAFLSGNGQHHVLFGVSSLWRSANYGSSWTNILSTNAVSTLQFLGGVASATGKYMTVTSVGNPGYTSNYIYTSKDCGATWISGSVSRTWASNIPAMSASGQYQIACTTNDYPWTSSDYGVTWTAVTTIQFNVIWCAAISASGQYQALAWYGGQIYISVNYGVTWSLRTSLSNYLMITLHMSGNGRYIFASSQNQLPYFSSDYGNTWTSLSTGGVCVAMSYTGQYILINTTNTLSLSQNYGTTFGPTNSRMSGTAPGYLAAINATAQYIYGFGSESLGGAPRDSYPQRGFLPILAPGGITGNMNINPYRLLANGSSSNLSFVDNGKTFLFGLANSQSATLLLPSTTTITPGWTCKIVNMNISGTGSNANLYVSSSQSLIYGQVPSGRSTFAHINVNGTTTVTNTYTKYVNIIYDGSNYYAIP